MGINYLQVGERIRSLRELRGMTVGELAEKTDFTTKSLLLAEHGKASLSIEFVLSLCAALGVTPNDILRGEYPEIPHQPDEREALIDNLVERLVGAQAEKTKSLTKINNTDQTVKEIESMVANLKREMKENEPVRGQPKYRGSYYK